MMTIEWSEMRTAEDMAASARAAVLALYSAAIQAHLDARARERQYDSIQTAVSYRDDPNPVFAAEGAALFNWRSAVWTAATAMLDGMGESSPPTIETVIAALPPFEWPEAEEE